MLPLSDHKTFSRNSDKTYQKYKSPWMKHTRNEIQVTYIYFKTWKFYQQLTYFQVIVLHNKISLDCTNRFAPLKTYIYTELMRIK